jgi:hypothetical protein
MLVNLRLTAFSGPLLVRRWISERTNDRRTSRRTAFVALARAAIHQVVVGTDALSIMTGMPGAWFADKQARSALTQAIGQAGAPWGEVHITVAPEAAGVFYAYVFETGALNAARAQGMVGVIDAGYRDVNVCYFAGGRYVAGESVAGGMVDALRQIKRLIADAYGVELALHEVDAVVRAGTLKVAGQLRPLPDGSSAALIKGLNTILATGRSLWPNGGKTLDAVVLGGGGAVTLGTHLRTEFAQLVVPGAGELRGIPDDQIGRRIAAADPQLAGARGFAAAATAALVSGVAG